ncbi:MAG: CARDB domain-containing protein [Candidatus Zixiibacteriota bacterium]
MSSGSSGGWLNLNVDIPDNERYCFILYLFQSDTSVCELEGAYVDDVAVKGTPLMPNLTFTTPSDWDAPVVVSHDDNSTHNGTLYAGQTAYINWAMINNGIADAGLSNTAVYVDNQLIDYYAIEPLAAGQIDNWLRRVEFTFTQGSHTIRVKYDTLEQIQESNENDNSYQITVNVNPALIPNLRFQTFPAWWGAPLVVANNRGGRHNEPLYASDTGFVCWTIYNSGTATAIGYFTRLYVDGALIAEYFRDSLRVFAYDTTVDVPVYPGQGDHVIEVVTDYGNRIAETNELDNTIVDTFTWQVPQLFVDGVVEYMKLGGQWPQYIRPAGFLVQLWLYDVATDQPRIMLQETYTNLDGWFTFSGVNNLDYDGTRLDFFVRVLTANDTVIVRKDTAGYFPFFVDGPHVQDAPDGWYTFNLPTHSRIWPDSTASAFFYVADVLRENWRKWIQLRPDQQPSQVRACLSRTKTTSYYILPGDTIYIPSDSILGTWSPDTFDRSVISHEFGHFLHFQLLFFIDTTSVANPFWESLIPVGQASREAFANFWASYETGTPVHHNSRYGFRDTLWMNLENGKAGTKIAAIRNTNVSANSMGDSCIGAVAGILWDIYDDTPGLEDFGGPQDWRRLDTIQHPDGRGDSIGLGIVPIVSALLDKAPYPYRPNTINEFWEKWFASPSVGHTKALKDIWYEHGEDRDTCGPYFACCTGIRGNVDGDPQDLVDIGDLGRMIDFIFFSAPLSSCAEENNVDGINGVDISDLSTLIDNLFFGGPLAQCPVRTSQYPSNIVYDH